MTILNVLKMGAASLLEPSEEITNFGSNELAELIDDMQETMKSLDGAGLAAPQIGVNKRLVIFGGAKSPRYPDAEEIPYTVLINPVITPLSDEKDDSEEGCLSLPGVRGQVARFTHINYKGFDPQGKLIDRDVSDFHARVVQHECDHLDGILFPMVMTDLSTLRML